MKSERSIAVSAGMRRHHQDPVVKRRRRLGVRRRRIEEILVHARRAGARADYIALYESKLAEVEIELERLKMEAI